ncbi:MAG: DUF4365 domain-containing protein [Leptolyngbya sp. Prado105]|jgi:hypothetical protein|nr:DUF4365 domain-containing protein [Leptolyngbya sp. Prado105]
MDINLQKEQFSYAHIYAIAAAAGYSFQLAPRPPDYDGIDVIIAGRDETNWIRYPRLELQVKSTSAEIISTDSIRFPLSIKNYDDLRIEHLQTPRILVVVILPVAPQDWTRQAEQELCLRHTAYWISLHGYPASQNQTTITISIPRQNILNVDALRGIMQRVAAGERL